MAHKIDFQTLIKEKDIPIVKLLAKAAKPYSQRARALLELNKGGSPEDAAQISGLRVTQVKYWQNAYRTSGLNVFPDSLLTGETEPEDITEALKAEDRETPVSRPPSAKTLVKKDKKAKKVKKAEKDKSVKKDKKPKKDKKTKKKDKKVKKVKKDKSPKKDKKKDKKKKKEKAGKKTPKKEKKTKTQETTNKLKRRDN